MKDSKVILVLGDQLTQERGALAHARPGVDRIVMAEVADEAGYVRHNRHKIVLIFAAMRHFCEELRAAGHDVSYFTYDQGVGSLSEAVDKARTDLPDATVHCTEPGEYRVQALLEAWSAEQAVPFSWHRDDHFLSDRESFGAWAEGRKQLRMEYFYRDMRRRYKLLVDDDDKPEGGRWNYDQENRKGWRSQEAVPPLPPVPRSAELQAVIDLVEGEFPDNPGDLTTFNFAVTAEHAAAQLDDFVTHRLGQFGRFQDALADDEPWLFHSLISMYLNIGLLDPLETCRRVESAFQAGLCDLASAEGFIRQVLGWREYVRGIYWLAMPEYAERNSLATDQPLPAWFWDADVDMRCMQKAISQSLDLGYAHHIQRLMVIGNFALLTGLDVRAVCDWYLAVYVDAFEWVELPNTLGMALHGDGGLMASKPYAASGKYIQRQGDHCKQCRYNPAKVTGEEACPYNSLYWAFLNKHQDSFSKNPRMGLALKNWQRKEPEDQRAILEWAAQVQQRLVAS